MDKSYALISFQSWTNLKRKLFKQGHYLGFHQCCNHQRDLACSKITQ